MFFLLSSLAILILFISNTQHFERFSFKQLESVGYFVQFERFCQRTLCVYVSNNYVDVRVVVLTLGRQNSDVEVQQLFIGWKTKHHFKKKNSPENDFLNMKNILHLQWNIKIYT